MLHNHENFTRKSSYAVVANARLYARASKPVDSCTRSLALVLARSPSSSLARLFYVENLQPAPFHDPNREIHLALIMTPVIS